MYQRFAEAQRWRFEVRSVRVIDLGGSANLSPANGTLLRLNEGAFGAYRLFNS